MGDNGKYLMQEKIIYVDALISGGTHDSPSAGGTLCLPGRGQYGKGVQGLCRGDTWQETISARRSRSTSLVISCADGTYHRYVERLELSSVVSTRQPPQSHDLHLTMRKTPGKDELGGNLQKYLTNTPRNCQDHQNKKSLRNCQSWEEPKEINN